LFCAKLEG